MFSSSWRRQTAQGMRPARLAIQKRPVAPVVVSTSE